MMMSKLKPGGYLVLILPDMAVYPTVGSGESNSDHEWDCYKDDVAAMIHAQSSGTMIQAGTLSSKLATQELTPRDRRIADAYGHPSLNFSMEFVFRKKVR